MSFLKAATLTKLCDDFEATINYKGDKPDPRIGLDAMLQAIEVHRSGELNDFPMEDHLAALVALARRKNLAALGEALRQRYPGKVA
jgi:hypothetical protein